MIKLQIEDYCQNCPEFEAYVAKLSFLTIAKIHNETLIKCERAELCEMLMHHLEKENGRKHEESLRCPSQTGVPDRV